MYCFSSSAVSYPPTRKQDNIKFQRDQKGFLKTLEGQQISEGKKSAIEKFVNFWVAFGRKTKNTKYSQDGGDEKIAW